MNRTRGVVPMFPVSMGGVVPDPGRASIDRIGLKPSIPARLWASVRSGVVGTPESTPSYAQGTPVPIPGEPVTVAPTFGGSQFTVTIGGQTVTIGLPGSGGDCCG